MVRALHAAGIEVILDVVYNHTAEGNHLGPTLSFKGIDNAAYYRLDRRRPAVLHGLHGHRQQPERAPPALAAAHHGLACATGSPRCTSTASASTSRRRSPASSTTSTASRPSSSSCSRTRSSRRSSSSPSRGTSAPAATRWATSRRSGPSGTASTATPCATSGAASPRPSASSPAAHRIGRPVRARRTPPGRVASTSSPRTTASRCATSCRTTRSTTTPTARTATTARPQPLVELGRRGRDRRRRDPGAARAAQQRNFLATLLLSQGVPMLLHGDELGRTQQRQQQRLRAGQRDQLDRLGRTPTRDLDRVHRRGHRAASRAPDLPAQRFFDGRPVTPRRGRAPARHRLADDRRRRHATRTSGNRSSAKAIGMFLNGHGIRGRDARGGRITDVNFVAVLQRQRRDRRRSSCRPTSTPRAGRSSSTAP